MVKELVGTICFFVRRRDQEIVLCHSRSYINEEDKNNMNKSPVDEKFRSLLPKGK